ncbi:hypothetical protein [Yersinia rochesterensis]|uniref:Uncharacterized protein n=1 Tax=Yersinia rochesterensis TaxID=1604335 RepID=A0A8D4SMY3_9GAMM|nr:hypothetical protein [Yersinia rochesterensis]AYD43829.1 hypothetical protein DXZ79_09060 [Yersinia rochesterensis]
MNNIQTEYEHIRATIGGNCLITLLTIGHQSTTVIIDDSDMIFSEQLLTVGSNHVALNYFKHNPPTADEMETAIMVVEDEVIRISSAVNKTSRLITTDHYMVEIAQLAGLPMQAEIVMSLESVERMFDRLAAVMMGRPAASEGIPADNEFAARLLILREFMHHLQFPSITILISVQ